MAGVTGMGEESRFKAKAPRAETQRRGGDNKAKQLSISNLCASASLREVAHSFTAS